MTKVLNGCMPVFIREIVKDDGGEIPKGGAIDTLGSGIPVFEA